MKIEKMKNEKNEAKPKQNQTNFLMRSDGRSQPSILVPNSSHTKSRSGGKNCYFF